MRFPRQRESNGRRRLRIAACCCQRRRCAATLRHAISAPACAAAVTQRAAAWHFAQPLLAAYYVGASLGRRHPRSRSGLGAAGARVEPWRRSDCVSLPRQAGGSGRGRDGVALQRLTAVSCGEALRSCDPRCCSSLRKGGGPLLLEKLEAMRPANRSSGSVSQVRLAAPCTLVQR